MKLDVEKKKHVRSKGPFERNFCVITSSKFSEELFISLERKNRREKGNKRKEKSKEKGEKSLSICVCLSKKALFPLRMKGNVTVLFQSMSG